MYNKVTILILIDGFLQLIIHLESLTVYCRHNPYFNRWFSAINVLTLDDFNCIESQSLF